MEFKLKCPCCGGENLHLCHGTYHGKPDTYYFICMDCWIGIEVPESKTMIKYKKEEKKMDNNSAIGGSPVDIDAITKKIEKGENVTPEDIAAVTKGCNTTDMLFMLAFLLLISGWGGNSSADYWRGKYDAYKELIEKKEDRPS